MPKYLMNYFNKFVIDKNTINSLEKKNDIHYIIDQDLTADEDLIVNQDDIIEDEIIEDEIADADGPNYTIVMEAI